MRTLFIVNTCFLVCCLAVGAHASPDTHEVGHSIHGDSVGHSIKAKKVGHSIGSYTDERTNPQDYNFLDEDDPDVKKVGHKIKDYTDEKTNPENYTVGTSSNKSEETGLAGPINVNRRGLAIKGYDVVSYIKDHKAVKGSSKFKLKWRNATWYFSSHVNKESFRHTPLRYVPQYGGYCAVKVSKGVLDKKIDPNSWHVLNGKIYLFQDKKSRKEWLRNLQANKSRANHKWNDLL